MKIYRRRFLNLPIVMERNLQVVLGADIMKFSVIQNVHYSAPVMFPCEKFAESTTCCYKSVFGYSGDIMHDVIHAAHHTFYFVDFA